MPKVSIILPTYNRADTVLRAVNSAQQQTFADWELIIVDDGSQDDTAAIVTGVDPRVSVIRQENGGMTSARNTALRAAKGTYCAFLDSVRYSGICDLRCRTLLPQLALETYRNEVATTLQTSEGLCVNEVTLWIAGPTMWKTKSRRPNWVVAVAVRS